MDRIKKWKVHDEDYLSDHKLISYELDFEKEPPKVSRNYKKANWLYFKTLLSQKSLENPPKFWSKETIELEAKKLVNDIIQALDKVCPEKEHRTKKCSPSWWTIEVHNLRKKLKGAENKWKNMCRNPIAKQRTIQEKYDAYKSIKKSTLK